MTDHRSRLDYALSELTRVQENLSEFIDKYEDLSDGQVYHGLQSSMWDGLQVAIHELKVFREELQYAIKQVSCSVEQQAQLLELSVGISRVNKLLKEIDAITPESTN